MFRPARALRRPTPRLLRWALLAGLVGAWLALARPSPLALGYGALVVLFLVLLLVGATTLAWMLYAWREPAGIEAVGFAESDRPAAHSFSLILPARHEERVLGATIAC
ncbi:MAG TPA: hypothetical protein VM844_09730, partial [Miltoncostaeaceae bacterium]|nr:hypothetical protein [Miltoncostaeaceae bacterium]